MLTLGGGIVKRKSYSVYPLHPYFVTTKIEQIN